MVLKGFHLGPFELLAIVGVAAALAAFLIAMLRRR